MYAKTLTHKVAKSLAQNPGLTRLSAGLARLPAGLRVQTNIKAGPCGGACHS
jgi:hypothetical protein